MHVVKMKSKVGRVMNFIQFSSDQFEYEYDLTSEY